MQSNPDFLKDAVKTIKSAGVTSDETVAWVNGIPITIGELEFRKGLNQAGGHHQSYSEVFNVLVEEKVVFDYAIKNRLLPTGEEVKRFVAEEQQQYAASDEYRKGVELFCQAANMSLEDYWNTYEWYNAFRFLTFIKSFEHAMKGLDLDMTQDGPEKYQAKQVLWKNLRIKLKSEAEVKMNNKFKELNLELDKSKLYL
ncbi:MAG: hypothetical protein ACPLSY_11910 [Moorellaceae bacterium]